MKNAAITPAPAAPRQKRLEIELGGKVRSLLFDTSFFEILTKKTSLLEIDELSMTKPWRVVPTLIVAALQAAAEFENKKDTFSYSTVEEWIEQLEDTDALTSVVDIYRANVLFFFQSIHGKPKPASPEPADADQA